MGSSLALFRTGLEDSSPQTLKRTLASRIRWANTACWHFAEKEIESGCRLIWGCDVPNHLSNTKGGENVRSVYD